MKDKILPVLRQIWAKAAAHKIWCIAGAAVAGLAIFFVLLFSIPALRVNRGDAALAAKAYGDAVYYYESAVSYAASPLPGFFYRLGEGLGLGSYPDFTREKLALGQEALVQDQIERGQAALESGDVETGETLLLALPVRDVTAGDAISTSDRAQLEQDIAFAKALAQEASGEYLAAAEAFDALDLRSDAPETAARCRAEQAREDALALQAEKRFDSALLKFEEAAMLPEAEELVAACEAERLSFLPEAMDAARNTLAASAWNTALTLEGKATVLGDSIMARPEGENLRFASGMTGIYVLKNGKVQVLRGGNGTNKHLEKLTSVVKVTGGIGHVLALQADGTVTALGSDTFTQCSGVSGQKARAIAAGALHSAIVLENGTVVAAGDNSFGQCDANGVTSVASVAAGLHHTVLLMEDGTVRAFGDNEKGQCHVSSWKNIRAVYCGGNFTIGLTEDFTLVATGDNSLGQCEVKDFTSIVSVACGLWHVAAVDLEGNYFFTGSNANGQMTLPEGAPVKVSAVTEKTAEDIYGTASEDGPWLYAGSESIVSVYKDNDTRKGLIRSDLYTTYGKQPFGAFADLDEDGRHRQRPARVARQNRVVYAQTGDFITYHNNKKGVMIRNGRVYYDKKDAPTMAFLQDGTMRLYEPGEVTADELLALGVENSFAFGPILVKDGEVHPTASTHPLRPSNYRCTLGMTEAGHFISLTCDIHTGRTLKAIAQHFVDMGCVAAYNLDGGNSTGVVFMGEQINLHQYDYTSGLGMRPLPDVLALTVSEAVPTVDDPQIRAEQFMPAKPPEAEADPAA